MSAKKHEYKTGPAEDWTLHNLMEIAKMCNGHTTKDVARIVSVGRGKATNHEHIIQVAKGRQSQEVEEHIKRYIRRTVVEHKHKFETLSETLCNL